MEDKLAKAATKEGKCHAEKGEGPHSAGRVDDGLVPPNKLAKEKNAIVSWEQILEGRRNISRTRVRKPPIQPVNWFGIGMSESKERSSSSSTENLEEGDKEWKEVERRKKKLVKKNMQKVKRKERMEEVATRMQHRVGVGPIRVEVEEHYLKETNNHSEARENGNYRISGIQLGLQH